MGSCMYSTGVSSVASRWRRENHVRRGAWDRNPMYTIRTSAWHQCERVHIDVRERSKSLKAARPLTEIGVRAPLTSHETLIDTRDGPTDTAKFTLALGRLRELLCYSRSTRLEAQVLLLAALLLLLLPRAVPPPRLLPPRSPAVALPRGLTHGASSDVVHA